MKVGISDEWEGDGWEDDDDDIWNNRTPSSPTIPDVIPLTGGNEDDEEGD